MGKDVSRKTRGSWWIGWVQVTYGEHEFIRTTDWEFATAGQAHRAAEAVAGSLATQHGFTIVGIGARRCQ